VQDQIVSHGGLTYGSLLYTPRLKQSDCVEVLRCILHYYASMGIRHLTYKAVPGIFHRSPGQEDLYAVWRLGGQLTRRDVSTAVDLRAPQRVSKGRQWMMNKARKANIQIRRQSDPTQFHSLLTGVLARHGATPAHTLHELRHLMGAFPIEIQLYEAVRDAQLLAGALVFVLDHTAHTQYLANSPEGREVGALDALLGHLIQKEFAGMNYLSLGISTTAEGKTLNEGLIAQKEGLGGSSVCHDFYELAIETLTKTVNR
jgi:hypothetical protein